MLAVGAGLAAAAFVIALVEGMLRLPDKGSASWAVLLLGAAAGVLSVLGASAWLTQAGAALAAGAAAVLLVALLPLRALAQPGWTLLLPASAVAGMVCLMSVFVGELPAWAPLPVLAIPWLVALAARRVAARRAAPAFQAPTPEIQ